MNAGAFDSMGLKRKQFFTAGKSGDLFIDELLTYGERFSSGKEDDGCSLFGEVEELKPERPEIPQMFFRG